jgi:hypothetical protein
VTPPPGSYPDVSNPVAAPALPTPSPARQFTEPLRELAALALLIGNGVFLFIGFSRLFFVVHGWGTGFGVRCEAVFGTFVGPLALGLPIVALLLGTHVAPMVRRNRAVLITIMVELAVSAVFGAITFLGAFAQGLSSVRETIEGTLGRTVWLAFLVLACIVVARVWLGLYPAPRTAPRPGYPGYGQPTYGRPYPGQPLYPHGTLQPATAGSPIAGAQTAAGPTAVPVQRAAETGWPLVPPPPRPAPLTVEPTGDLTMRVAAPGPGDLTQQFPSGDLTQAVPPHDLRQAAPSGDLTQVVPSGEHTQVVPAPVPASTPPPVPVDPAPEAPEVDAADTATSEVHTSGDRPSR